MEYVLYISVYDPKIEELNIIELSPKNVSSGNNSYQHKVINSITQNELLGFEILNFPSIGTFPFYSKVKYLKSFKWGVNNYQYGGFNILFLRSVSRYLKTRKVISRAYKKYGKNLRVIVYNPYNPIMKAVSKFNGKINTTLIVPDLPEFQSLQVQRNPIVSMVHKYKSDKSYSYLCTFDHFVFMTDAMKKNIVKGTQTYSVVEGICSCDEYDTLAATSLSQDIINRVGNRKYILYTGKLTRKYGVLDLLDAFELIDNQQVNLVICGSGETYDFLQERSSINSRLIFLGMVNLETANFLQSNAFILVNPRVNSNFTKYSFPSKTIEYLEKRVPVVMHRLHCMPSIYEDFVFFTEKESVDGLKDTLNKVIEADADDIKIKTSAGYDYVTNCLSAKVHSKKFIGVDKCIEF